VQNLLALNRLESLRSAHPSFIRQQLWNGVRHLLRWSSRLIPP
jgi:hypothetical protein